TVAFSSLFFAALVTERTRAREALERSAAELEDRVARRTAELSAANERLNREIAERHDTDRKLRQREGQLAEVQQQAQVGNWEWLIPEDRVSWADEMQRSLLPDRLPEIPGVLLAARYLPATSDLEVGGDWYDVVQLPNGSLALAIGDVAGHGLRAASTMGQLRMALRAYALEEGSPSQVVGRVRRLVRVLVPDIVTLIYLVFDPESGTLRFANAGHPPPLLVEGKGQ